ncbi:MAG: type II CRISPR RNA-guided endonuclease Cas9 [Roseiarcus sp.]
MRILGIDLGIASCGWAVIELETEPPRIVGAGARCFDAPLVDKTGEPKSAARRMARGQRRVIRRRTQRMNAIRRILHAYGLIVDASKDALQLAARRLSPRAGADQTTPWLLRAKALERALNRDEFAVVIGHIARHRGFRSNSKRDAGANAPDETSKMKKAIAQTREGLARYRSFGEMLACDPRFADHKRNRDKDFSHTPQRSDLEAELRAIFAAQRRAGNPDTMLPFEREIAGAIFFQRPLQDSEDKVGPCPHEPTERRTAKCAPSFELFRFLSKLVNLSITVGRSEQPLTVEELAKAERAFAEQKGFTFKRLRKLLDLDANARFAGVPLEKESWDLAARNGSAGAGTRALREALGEAPWASLQRSPEKLDRIAEVLAFREDLDRIKEGLADVGLDEIVAQRLMQAAEAGSFTAFSGAGHISAKAARNIIPGLRTGLRYDEACARVGYDHAARRAVSLDEINSPVTRRAFAEAMKQIRVVSHELGPIDTVHIELARDVGKSAEERRKMSDGLDTRSDEKARRGKIAAEILGRQVGPNELLRYELAFEQAFKCVYCYGDIARDGFGDADARYQVDHILPWSRFGDDSYQNKTLCCARCNQEKRGRTPCEWFEAEKDDASWERFTVSFDTFKEMKWAKKRKFLLKDATAIEEKFKERNLNDTRWASRLLADELKRLFPAEPGQRRVFARPGAITSKLRQAWGLESMKKIDGERVSDDRHHAVDAAVLAATTEGLLHRMTTEIQQREQLGRTDDIFHVAPPWRHFREEVQTVVYGGEDAKGVFVSRAERRRARGKAHDATVRQIREVDGAEAIFERKAIEKLTLADLDKIPTPEPYGNVAEPGKLRDQLVATLRAWIDAGKPKDPAKLPRSPKGDVVRKVRVRTNAKVGVRINGGAVDRGEMARIDVFRKANKKGRFQYFLVPIYPHEIATLDEPPNRAVQGGGDEAKWPTIGADFEFLWSINQMSLVEVVKAEGDAILGYFRSFDVNTGAITVSAANDPKAIRKGIGARTLKQFKKLQVDRLGRINEVPRELRTWRGKVCT